MSRQEDIGNSRSISQIITAKTTTEGDGFIVHRAFPNSDIREFDPFLLLDEMGPINFAPGDAKGASDHPHRGFETVTYLLDGVFEHKDSQGNSGRLFPGDVQWMTAGSGVIHSEMPEKEFAEKGGTLHGFQLWINLPKKYKMTKPNYQDITSKNIPIVKSADGLIQVKIIAGQSMGKIATIETKTSIFYLHFSIQPGGKISQKIPTNFNCFAYVISGEGLFGIEVQHAKKGQVVFFDKSGDEVVLSSLVNAQSVLEVILLAGAPLDEPITRHGPFVMNTEEEIRQAISDYNNGKMGTIESR